MKVASVLFILFFIACGKPEPPAATPPPAPAIVTLEAPKVVWRSDLQPCTQGACGNVTVNAGWMSIESGEITVAEDGSVAIRIERFSNANSTPGANRRLEIWFGNFTSTGFQSSGVSNPVGFFSTDNRGNYDGPAGKFPCGRGRSGVFIVNEPGVRSLFVSEYLYKD